MAFLHWWLTEITSVLLNVECKLSFFLLCVFVCICAHWLFVNFRDASRRHWCKSCEHVLNNYEHPLPSRYHVKEANSAKNPAGKICRSLFIMNRFSLAFHLSKCQCALIDFKSSGKLQKDYIEWCGESDYCAAPWPGWIKWSVSEKFSLKDGFFASFSFTNMWVPSATKNGKFHIEKSEILKICIFSYGMQTNQPIWPSSFLGTHFEN